MLKIKPACVVLAFLLTICQPATAQNILLKGVVKDSHSEEPVPFASVVLTKLKRGGITDSSGNFSIKINGAVNDTLQITYVGYVPFTVPISLYKDSTSITIKLVRGEGATVIVKSKHGRGWVLWRKIVKRKALNDRVRFDNFSYEIYNKLELDFNKVNKEKLSNIKLLKPFSFIFDNVDTLEFNTPVLPVLLTETLSDFYYQKDPKKIKEVIKATKTSGIKNESFTKLLGGTYQNINIYDNFLPVFDKQFVNPLSDRGEVFYDYAVPDTQYISGRRFFHWVFSPKRPGENTFEGDAWINDTTFAVQRITMHLGKDASINFLKDLSLFQEYTLISDSIWFLSKDKFIADVYPIGKNNFGLKGRKTTTYRKVELNQPATTDALLKNKTEEDVVVQPGNQQPADSFWVGKRHEGLSKSEKSIYHMIDTLETIPLYKTYKKTLSFIVGGNLQAGKFIIGPWFNWVSSNSWEGTRLRFDLSTNSTFNKKIKFHGYAAYGFLDKKWKGQFETVYLFSRQPRTSLHFSYKNDLDNGNSLYEGISQDNVSTIALRKPGVFRKFLQSEETKLELYTETYKGLSFLLSGASKSYTPLRGLPLKTEFYPYNGSRIQNFETSIRIRYAYLERFIEDGFLRNSLGADRAIIELKYSKGIKGVLNGNYDYDKLQASVHGSFDLPPTGKLDYNIFGGKVFGSLPFPLLEIHPGNDLYYYNTNAFNLMNRFEFISDIYAGAQVEHNFGNALLKFVPLVKKFKIRQFWNAKFLVGGLSDANKQLNFTSNSSFQALNSKPYLEVGTGLENIFKVLRLDFVYRVLPKVQPANGNSNFGIFFSFKVSL